MCCVLCRSVVSDCLRLHELYPTLYSMDRLLSPCDSSGKNTGVSCHFLLQGILLTQRWIIGSLALQANSLPSEPLGKPTWKTAWAQIFWILTAAAAAAKSCQLCPTLCDPIDGSPTGSSVPGILQARILEWVAISFSNAWKWKVKVKSLSHRYVKKIPQQH